MRVQELDDVVGVTMTTVSDAPCAELFGYRTTYRVGTHVWLSIGGR